MASFVERSGSSIFAEEIAHWVWGPLDFHRLAMISLLLQVVLFMAAPFRKSTANGIFLGLIWAAFLLAELVSYFSIALVVNGLSGHAYRHDTIWMLLLLAHIGGPDNISALDMEDHQQWSRTALRFGAIAYSTARVTIIGPPAYTYPAYPESHRHWSIPYYPVIILFVVGVIKSLERIAALVVNRTVVIQDRVVRQMKAKPSNFKLVDGAVLVKKPDNCSKPIKLSRNKKNLSQICILRDAYQLFQVFKGYYVDFKFELRHEDNCTIREYFLDRTSEEAFGVIEIELNLMYDVFYTKAYMFRKLVARLLRYFTIIAEAVVCYDYAYASFETEMDLTILAPLIFGNLFMDVIATLGIIFSIWSIVPADDDSFCVWLHKKLKKQPPQPDKDDYFSIRGRLLNMLLNITRRTWGTQSSREGTSCLQLVKRMLFRRWSESISQFNFIDYCLRRPPAKWRTLFHFPEFKEKIRMAKYVSHQWFTDSIRNFIFKELKSKARPLQAQGADHGHSSSSNSNGELADPIPPEFFISWMAKLELDECLLVWHIATNLCHTVPADKDDKYFQWSKTLSNYMLYLLIHQPHMLKQSEVRLMSKIRLKEAYEEAKLILDELPSGDSKNQHAKAREKINGNWKATFEKDGVVYKGCQLADQLRNTKSKWEIISKAWVSLLCRTATESEPSAHITALNRGGELLTIVWLLMNHLGIDSWKTELQNPTEVENPAELQIPTEVENPAELEIPTEAENPTELEIHVAEHCLIPVA